MSFVIAAPELMTSAATDLATIGSNVNAAHVATAARTVAVVPAAGDEVSTSIAHLFPSTLRAIRGWPVRQRRFRSSSCST